MNVLYSPLQTLHFSAYFGFRFYVYQCIYRVTETMFPRTILKYVESGLTCSTRAYGYNYVDIYPQV